jgi:hypothetical protein
MRPSPTPRPQMTAIYDAVNAAVAVNGVAAAADGPGSPTHLDFRPPRPAPCRPARARNPPRFGVPSV